MAIKTMVINDVGETDDDKNPVQQMQIQTYDATKNCGKLGHYGFYGNAPKGSLVIVLQANGQEETLFGAEDDVNNRPRGLAEGEVMMYNTVTKSYVYLNKDGDVEIYAKTDINVKAEGVCNIICENANITAGTTTINGNSHITGNLVVDGTSTLNGACTFENKQWLPHTHTGNMGSPTSGVN